MITYIDGIVTAVCCRTPYCLIVLSSQVASGGGMSMLLKHKLRKRRNSSGDFFVDERCVYILYIYCRCDKNTIEVRLVTPAANSVAFYCCGIYLVGAIDVAMLCYTTHAACFCHILVCILAI